MVQKVINFFLRFLGTIGLSSAICISLSWISVGVLYLVMTLVPRFISNMFNFTSADVASDVMKDQLIPGWGTLSSIVNDPNFSTRVSMILYTIIVVIALCIVGFLVYLLMKVVKGNKFFTILFAVVAVMLILYTFVIMFGVDDFYGIEKGWGFYLTSIIVFGLLSIIKLGIATSLWKGEEW